MGTLEGRTAVITGAARGQGAAAARRFVAEGARVVIADVRDELGKDLAAELGATALYRHLDVTSEQDWATVVGEVQQSMGGLDALVNNAGILRFAALPDLTLEEFTQIVTVNQVGTFLGMREAARAMLAHGRGGSIVNISSVEGLAGMALLTAYSGTKFAIRGMTKAAAVELGPKGIRVNSVHPGMIGTDMLSDAVGAELDFSPMAERIPLKRLGTPDDVAEVVAFLAGDQARYCTGGEYAVDGGATATHSFYLG